MNAEHHEDESPPDGAPQPLSSRDRRAENVRAWQRMQYMGGMPEPEANTDSPEKDDD